jgi:hypothetical protein
MTTTDAAFGSAALVAPKDAAILHWIAEMPDDFDTRVRSRLVVTESGCWEWPSGRSGVVYGEIRLPYKLGYRTPCGTGVKVTIHRAMWLAECGVIPYGMVLDHDNPEVGCRNRRCANPAHLTLATPRGNTLTGTSPAARNAVKTTCSQGHDITRDDQVTKSGLRRGKRLCATCAHERAVARDADIRAARHLLGMSWADYYRTYGQSGVTARRILADAEEAQ